MTEPDPDILARRTLRQHRLFATGLLVLMAALTVASYLVPPSWWAGLAASGRQGRVHRRHRGLVRGDGAVSPSAGHTNSAYRHHPQPARAPGSGARPFRRQPRLHRAPRSPACCAGWICRASCTASWPIPRPPIPRRSPCRACCRSMLASVEDGRARRVLGADGARESWVDRRPAQVVARALHSLVDGGRHQEVFGFILGQLKPRWPAGRTRCAPLSRSACANRAAAWSAGRWAPSIARRVLAQINAELDKMSPDGSELRAAFDEWVRREINRMETEPERAAEVGDGDPAGGRARDGPGLDVGHLGAHPHRRWRPISPSRTGAWWPIWKPRWATSARSWKPIPPRAPGCRPRRRASSGRCCRRLRSASPSSSARWWRTGTPRRWWTGWNCAWARTCNISV